MSLLSRLKLYWRNYSLPERYFVILPFLILTPRLIDHTKAGYDGEPSQEFIITIALIGLSLTYFIFSPQAIEHSFRKMKGTKWVIYFVGAFASWSAISIFWTSDLGATLSHTALWGNYFVVLLLGKLILRRRSVVGVYVAIILSTFSVAIIRLVQYAISIEDRSIISPIYMNIGVETEILVTALPLICVVFLSTRRKALAYCCLIIGAIVLAGSLSTYQRTPLLAILCSVIILTIGVAFRVITYVSWRRPILLGGVLLATAWLQVSLPSGVRTYEETPLNGKEFIASKLKRNPKMESDAIARITSWRTALEMLQSHPVRGIGAGNYKAGYSEYRSQSNQNPFWTEVKDYSQHDGMECNYRAHNEFLQIGSELGGIGLFIVGLILVSLLFLYLSVWKTNSSLVVGMVASTAAFLISSNLTSFSFRWMPCGFYFFLTLCLVLPLAKYEANSVAVGLSSWQVIPKSMLISLTIFLVLAAGRTTQVMASQYYELGVGRTLNNSQEAYIERCHKALAIDPYNFSVAYGLGATLYRMNRPQEALPYLNYGVNHGINNVGGYAVLGLATKQAGDPASANQIIAKGASVYSASLFLRALYVTALDNQGLTQNAEVQRRLAQEINPAAAEVWEAVIRDGIQGATLLANNKKLPHPAKLFPKVGVSVMQDYRRVYLEMSN